MTEPKDMIVPMLTEMRAESRDLRTGAFGERLGALETKVDEWIKGK